MPYDDLDRPPLDAGALRSALTGPGRFWTDVEVTEQTGSTNADVAAAARAGASEGTVHVTDLQVAGRGRLDRVWESPAGSGIAVSVLLRPDEISAARWVWLPLLVGLAVDATVRELGVDCGLKWPNDVLVDDRKLAGILLERVETPLGPMICDHKTKGGSIGGGYQDAVWQDFQLRAYAAAARDYLGIPVVGALYDVVAKTALRLRKGELPSELLERQVARYREQPDEMFARVPVLFEERHIESARVEIADAVRLVRGFHNDGWFPGHRTQCRNPVTGHKACDFLEYCDAGRDAHVLRMGFHQEDTPHTELSDGTAH